MNFNCFRLWRFGSMLCMTLAIGWLSAAAQENTIVIRGTVRSDTAALEGVTVMLKTDPKKATKTDEKGRYFLKVPANGTLVFTFIGYKKLELDIKGDNVVNATLKTESNALDEVAVVAYGTQKKSSMVSAITTIDPADLKGPTSNLTTMLQGQIAGIIAYQRSGEPGNDNASFFIRGITTFGTGNVNPLILIDGMESSSTDLARLQPDDIAGFSVLKDATAASLYGARGANGVILVTTKTGTDGKAKFTFRVENSLSSNTRDFKFADNITYMNLNNEAVTTRDPSLPTPYSAQKIAMTAAGADPYLYPNNNWINQLIKPYTDNQRYDLNVQGGTKNAHYYVSGTYNIDNGVLNVDKLNNFNSNIKLRSYEIRSNIVLDFTPTTQATVRTSGQFDSYGGPVGGGGAIFNSAMTANPVQFPAIYPSSFAPDLLHPLFGNASIAGTQLYDNPYADMVSGYQQYGNSTLIAQLELKQDLRGILPGLTARMMTYTNRFAHFDLSRQYSPFYYSYALAPGSKIASLTPLNDNGTEYLSFIPGSKDVISTNYIETALNYNHTFAKHHTVTGMLIGTMYSSLDANAGGVDANGNGDLEASLPHRNEGVSGRFTYGYEGRYMAEFNFGYNGSERFAENHRFGFFPSAGVAWNIANEPFWQPLLKTVDRLKLRATYGLVGNDQIGSDDDRFFYLSNVNMSDPTKAQSFGTNWGYTQNGISILRYPNPDITWEKAYKANYGIEAHFLKAVTLNMDVYHELRTNILMDRSNIPSSMGLQTTPQANTGKASGSGIEGDLNFQQNFGHSFWLLLRGTFTYAVNKLLVDEEPNYPEPYRSHVGHPLAQNWGLVAERLFVDDQEVANSPVQDFGEVRGGDIKYRDINHDGQIEGNGDQVPIGLPTEPEITYGFGWTFGWKGFEFSAFFAGNARTSFFISNNQVQPYVTDGSGHQNGLLKAVADDHWSENNQNLYAFWPRLSDHVVLNNYWTSTWWMRNGEFVRLKNTELDYTLPARFTHKYHVGNCKFYVNAANLFAISKFKMWDPEMAGNGLGYPIQRVYNTGVILGF